MSGKTYHPAVETGANYWCGQIADVVEPEKLAVFKETLLEAISKIFDLPEGVIEIHTKVPNSRAYAIFGKAGKPGDILLNSLKKAKIKSVTWPEDVTMTISTSVVKIDDTEAEERTQILWKAPLMRKR